MMMNFTDRLYLYKSKGVLPMGFTNEEHSEEILYKSHSLGIKDELWSTVSKLREEDPFLTIHEAIQKAYHTLTN